MTKQKNLLVKTGTAGWEITRRVVKTINERSRKRSQVYQVVAVSLNNYALDVFNTRGNWIFDFKGLSVYRKNIASSCHPTTGVHCIDVIVNSSQSCKTSKVITDNFGYPAARAAPDAKRINLLRDHFSFSDTLLLLTTLLLGGSKFHIIVLVGF